MRPTNHNEEDIFSNALEISSAESRAAYLRQACGDDVALHERVAALLRVAEEQQSFLEAPPPPLRETVNSPPLSEGPGTTIGSYRLLEQIGEGGMGIVFMAEQREPLRRMVALKIIKPGMDSKQVIARFEAERQALAMMDHPNIARVFDAGATEAGRLYFVMELVRGVPITRYCDEVRLTTRERLELFVSVCQATHHAHQKGIIHRDLKPSNVLVTLHDGVPVVKVIDFGIAKAVSGSLTDKTLFTGFSQFLGTPLYVSPEQAEMSGLDIDTRSDIYSLGVLLYELLTGTTPFDKARLKKATFDEIRKLIREEEPPRPSARISTLGQLATTRSERRQSDPRKLSRSLRGELDWIVMKALEKDRARRYETAEGFGADVQRYLNDEPVQACPPSAWYRFGKFARRHRGTLITAALVLGVLLTATASGITLALRATAAEESARLRLEAEKKAHKDSIAARKQAQAERDRLSELLYVANMRLAYASWQASETRRVKELLAACRPKKGEKDLRRWEWYYLWTRCHKGRTTLRAHEKAIDVVVCSPKGDKFATASRDKTVSIRNVATGNEVSRFVYPTHYVRSLEWSSDGEYLMSSDLKTITVREADTGKERLNKRETNSGAAWSADGRYIAVLPGSYSNGNRELAIRDAITGKLLQTVSSKDKSYIHLFAWSPVAAQLAIYAGGRIRIWDADQNKETFSFKASGPQITCLAWKNDGAHLATGDRDGTIHLWNVTNGRRWLLAQAEGKILDLKWNGVKLAAVDRVARAIYVWNCQNMPRAATLTTILRGHTADIRSVAWSPDGQRLISGDADGAVIVWDVAAREEFPFGESLTSLSFRPDGRELAVAQWDGRFFVVECNAWNRVSRDFSHGEIVAWWERFGRLGPAPPTIHRVSCMALSRDGKSLAVRRLSGRIEIWNRETRKLVHSWKSAGSPFGRLVWTDDGKQLRSAGPAQAPLIWDVRNGRVLRSLYLSPSNVIASSWSSDGRRAVISVGGKTSCRTFICDASGREMIRLEASEPVTNLVWSSDGKWLAGMSVGKATIQIWNAAAGELFATLQGHEKPVSAMAWSPDRRRLASLDTHGTVRIWDTLTYQEIATLRMPALEHGNAIAWSPNGRQLVCTPGWVGDAGWAYEQEKARENVPRTIGLR